MLSTKLKPTIPWFILGFPTGTNLANSVVGAVFITTQVVPEEVKDTKQLNYNEVSIPGGRASLIKFGSASARKISFSLKIANFNDDLGVSQTLMQFARLRSVPISVKNLPTRTANRPPVDASASGGVPVNGRKDPNLFEPFTPNLSCIYYNSLYGTMPVWARVLACDFTVSHPNGFGKPQYATVSIELGVDEYSMLNTIQEVADTALGLLGSLADARKALRGLTRPEKNPKNPYIGGATLLRSFK